MWLIKRLVLVAVLGAGFGFGGNAIATDLPLSSWNTQTQEKRPEGTGTVAGVSRVHSVAVEGSSIAWKLDLHIEGAKDQECLVTVELCNAAGSPYLRRDGTTYSLEETVTPDSDSYDAPEVEFRLSNSQFWLLYGRSAKDMTFRVIVKTTKGGKVLAKTKLLSLTGLGTMLPAAPLERTDNPGTNPARSGNVWMRLIFG